MTQKIILNIEGMHCEACAKVIKMKLDEQPGIVSAQVDDVKKQATIQFDPDLTNKIHIINLISNLGYQASE